MTLAEDKRPEATLLIDWSEYALQRHKWRVIIYIGRVSVGRRLKISEHITEHQSKKVRHLITKSYYKLR